MARGHRILIQHRKYRAIPIDSFGNDRGLTLAYIRVVDGLRAKAAIATARFAGLTVSEPQGLDWEERYDGQWHVERKVVVRENR
jgi:hypothetical protein